MNERQIAYIVGYFGFNGSLRQYFSLSSRLPERGRKKRETIGETGKLSEQPLLATTASTVGSCPILSKLKVTQHRRRKQKDSEIRKQIAKCVCKTKLMHSSYAYSQTPQMEPPSTCLKKK